MRIVIHMHSFGAKEPMKTRYLLAQALWHNVWRLIFGMAQLLLITS
ncbi:MAG: hypothetical protein J0J02_09415 [Thiobacillus sp.]|nr:hypothetical protein [Thiobacillus sp.]